MEKELLMNLGLTDGEAKVYLALAKLGSSTVGPIAKEAKVAYSNIYEILNRLLEKGLISFIIKEKTKYFQSIEPKLLYKFLDKQELEIEKSRDRLNKIIPELEKRTKFTMDKQEAEIFIGIKGLRTAYEKMFSDIDKKEIALFFYAYKEEFAGEIDNFYYRLAPFYKSINIRFRGLSSKQWAKSEYVKKTASFIDSKYVEFPLPGTIDIYQDMILEIAWGNKPVGILIQSKEIAQNYRTYFNEVWKIAKK